MIKIAGSLQLGIPVGVMSLYIVLIAADCSGFRDHRERHGPVLEDESSVRHQLPATIVAEVRRQPSHTTELPLTAHGQISEAHRLRVSLESKDT